MNRTERGSASEENRIRGGARRRTKSGSSSPAAERRRAQARRRRGCCCGSVLTIVLLFTVIILRGALGGILARERPVEEPRVQFPLEVQSARSEYYRHDLIPITVHAVDSEGNPETEAPPLVRVMRDGEVVETIGHYTDRVKLRWDPMQEAWLGHWPPGWNPEPGRYVVEARTTIDPTQWSWDEDEDEDEEADENDENMEDEPEEFEGESLALAVTEFELKRREPQPIEPGICVASWEFDFRTTFRGPDGSEGDWRKLYDWVEYVGADTFWFRGAVTDATTETLTLDQPFKPINLRAISRLGEEAQRRGLQFGPWLVAYTTYPRANIEQKPAYDYALDVSPSTGEVSEHNFISLLDDRRVDHMVDFFREMQDAEHVDMVGLDYMRSDRGGYEMTDRFVKDMPVKLPDEWDSWDTNRRMHWMAVKIEREWGDSGDPDFYEAWNWWRAHIGANIVRRVIERSGIDKPTWIFVLSWLHGVQHGQDPLMFTDAGTTMLAPMLYQVPGRGHFDTLVRSWHNYLDEGQVNLVPGNQVDFHWHQSMKDPPATYEFYDRTVVAHEQFISGGATQGAFWHDICRAASPRNLGPYSGREWALAGAAKFSRVRETWRVQPLRAELEAPDTAPIASQFTVQVKLENLTDQPVEGVRISLADTPHVIGVGLNEGREDRLFGEPHTTVGTIPAGETVEVPVTVRITRAEAERLNRMMLALRVTWEEGDFPEPVRNELPRVIVLMKYIHGR